MELAPIALFVYKRPEHARRTVEALRANHLVQQSNLFIFADAAKNESATEAVKVVRKFIRTINGFKSVDIIERHRNLGLSKSLIAGVTQLCSEYGRVIAVEDDILTAPDFLTFVNRALDRYADEHKIFSVSGFNYPVTAPASYPYDAFFSYRFPCWGWGTWKDRWERADWSVSDYAEFVADRAQQRQFNRGGNDLTPMLAQHMAGKIDSWDTVWGYTHSRHDAVSLLPVVSKVYNIGLDRTGTHCRRAPFKQNALPSGSESDYRLPGFASPDLDFAAQIQHIHHRSLARKIGRHLYEKLGLR
jgi:hypothetical protein